MECYLVIKKNEILSFAGLWVEVTKSEEDKKDSFIHLWNLRTKTKEQGKKKIKRQIKKQILNYKEQIDDCKWGDGWEDVLNR